MAHDTHFLQRLERLSSRHVEWALSMYRDPEFVRMVLNAAKIGDQAQRVALSLDDPNDGPFVIVDRKGIFITCLGSGMKPSDTPVVPRYVLDAQVQRLEVLRARKVIFDERVARFGTLPRLFRRIWDSGHRLSREEFIAASTMTPVIRDMLWIHLLSLLDPYMVTARRLLAGAVEKRLARPTDADLSDMRQLWLLAWQAGHTYALAGVDFGDETEPFKTRELIKTHTVEFDPAWVAIRTGLAATVIRASWTVAEYGKLFLKGTKVRLLHHAKTPQAFMSSVIALLAMGTRHPKTMGEIQKSLEKVNLDNFLYADDFREHYRAVLDVASHFLRDRQVVGEPLSMAMRCFFYDRWHGLKDYASSPEDIPTDLLRTLVANNNMSIHGGGATGVMPVMDSLSLVLRFPAEMMYFTAKDLAQLTSPWTPEYTINSLLLPARTFLNPRQPVVNTTPKVGRNDPCPCNSGKKHKVCCGK